MNNLVGMLISIDLLILTVWMWHIDRKYSEVVRAAAAAIAAMNGQN